MTKPQNQNRKKTFKALKGKIQADISSLKTTITRQTANCVKYTKEINALTVDIKTKSDLKKKNEKFLAQTIETRRVEKLRYEDDTKHRHNEMRIIRKLQKIVQQKLASMKDFLKTKVNN